LTVVDGLYSGDPRVDPQAEKIATVANIDNAVMDLAGSSKSSLGTGGMRSKLKAARIATAAGESVIIANGADPRTLDALFACEPVGTLFLPHGSALPAWKRWLGFTAQPKGKIQVNDGARKALTEQGKSLLPVGVVGVHGSFHKGDVVSLCDAAGAEFARGLSNYSAHDAARIQGLRTEKIASVLGAVPYEEIVHRDNLVVI
jgi:glutamate 5-kinase